MKKLNILTKIKAFFNFKGQEIEMDLSSAEVRQERVYLHPVNEPELVYSVKAKAVHMFIDPEEDVEEIKVQQIAPKNAPQQASNTASKIDAPPQTNMKTQNSSSSGGERGINWKKHNEKLRAPFVKKRFSIMLYEDEYESIMAAIEENGYKKAEYLLACVMSAKKNSMESTYNKFVYNHAERRKIEREELKKAKPELENQ